MALENGGLDAQVEQRMDAYRGNPQQLQQRYGQNKELLDLLALQKLTSEKQAASRDMQMKMQQQPGTIAQQREQEALELTKQEMGNTLGDLAGRTKSTLDQKQMTQQQNMSKMAQAASRPPQGGIGALMGGGAQPQARPPMGNPQTQGLAAARMAQGPSKFASGGIVSFAEGQQVQSGSPFSRYISDTYQGLKGGMSEAALRQRVQTLYGPYSAPVGGLFQQSDTNRARAKDIISRLQSGELSVPEMEALVQQYPEFRQNAAQVDARVSTAPNETSDRLGMTTGTSLDTPQGGIDTLLPPPASAPAPTATTAPNPDLLDPRGPNQTSTAPVTVGDAVPTTGDAVPTAGETAASFEVPQTAGTASTGVMGPQGATAADSAFLKGTRMADEYTGRAAASESYEGMKSRLSEFDKENYGPNDDLNAFLIGMGGTGSIGSAMKGGYSSMLRSKNNRRNRMMDEFQLEKDRIGADAVFSAAGIRLGTQLAADAAANERNIRTAAATMGAAKIRQAIADADRLARTNTAELEAAAKAVEQARLARKDKTAAALGVAQLTAKTRADLIGSLVSNDPMMMSISQELRRAGNDPEAAALLQKNMDTRMEHLNLVADGAMNEFGLLDAEVAAAKQLSESLGQPELNIDDVVKRSIEGE